MLPVYIWWVRWAQRVAQVQIKSYNENMLNRNPNPSILPSDKKEGTWIMPETTVDKVQEKLGGTLKKKAVPIDKKKTKA